jgi:dihydroorotate dehydrogenase (fumarate)
MELRIKTQIGELKLENCIWNAAGPRCTSLEELNELMDSKYSGAIVTKTCTLKQRKGNVFPRVRCEEPSVSINSVGLANEGLDMYLDWIKNAKKKKPVFLSISPFSCDEVEVFFQKIADAELHPDFVELNVSCPNLIGKSILAYDTGALLTYLEAVEWFYQSKAATLVQLEEKSQIY